jgi:hypothetical protein
MTMATTRRTHAMRLRREISDILEELDAIEAALGVFHRKRDVDELARAMRDYDALLLHVDQLGELLRDLKRDQESAKVLVEPLA